MQSKLRTHCMLKYIGQLKIAVNNHVRDDPWHTLATYIVSEFEHNSDSEINTITAEQLIYLQQSDASIDASLLGPAVHSHSLAVD